jgi:hypothetical protein
MSSSDTELVMRVAGVFYAYARGVDEGDLSALGDLVTGDVLVSRVGGDLRGRREFLEFYRSFHDSPVEVSHHMISNVEAEQGDDGTVSGRAYFSNSMFGPDGLRQVVGKYAATFRPDGERMPLCHLVIQVDRVVRLAGAMEQWQGAFEQ